MPSSKNETRVKKVGSSIYELDVLKEVLQRYLLQLILTPIDFQRKREVCNMF